MEQNLNILTAPEIHFTAAKVKHFENILQIALDNKEPIQTVHPYPTFEFLRYLVDRKQYLLHGSNHSEILVFKPRQQTDYEGRMITAVFAAEDGIAPIFYAILDRVNYKGSMRNMFRHGIDTAGETTTHYRFSIDADSLAGYPWVEGTIYVFSRDLFTQVLDDEGGPLLEWVSPQPVQPIARVHVTPNDFPFLNNVQGHDDRLEILMRKFLTSYDEVKELCDGYAFSYNWTNMWGADAMTLIDLLRADMSSIHINLNCEPHGGPVWFHLRGSTEIKALIQRALEQLGS